MKNGYLCVVPVWGAYMWCNCRNWDIMWYVWPCGVLCDIDSLEYIWIIVLFNVVPWVYCDYSYFTNLWDIWKFMDEMKITSEYWLIWLWKCIIVVGCGNISCGWLWKYSLWLVVSITSSYHTHSWNIGTTVATSEKHWQHLFKRYCNTL